MHTPVSELKNAAIEHTQVLGTIKKIFQSLKHEIQDELHHLEDEMITPENIQALRARLGDNAITTHIDNVLHNALAYLEQNPTNTNIAESIHRLGVGFVLCLELKLASIGANYIDLSSFYPKRLAEVSVSHTKKTGSFLQKVTSKVSGIFKPSFSNLTDLLHHVLSLGSVRK